MDEKRKKLMEELKAHPRFQQLREITEAYNRGAIRDRDRNKGNVMVTTIECPTCNCKNHLLARPNATVAGFHCRVCNYDMSYKVNWMLDHMSRVHNMEVSN